MQEPQRNPLPVERAALVHKFSIAQHEGYLVVGLYENGQPGEIFILMSKEGSTISGLTDSLAIAVSMALQYGVPLESLCEKFRHTSYEPFGWTPNQNIKFAASITDYVFRYLEYKFVKKNQALVEATEKVEAALAEVGFKEPAKLIAKAASQARTETKTIDAVPAPIVKTREWSPTSVVPKADGPPCVDCGSLMVRSGACYKCMNCGGTSGCS